ncbi:NUDIX hydrolase [Chloropicon primus]|uniref:NUDIX hydrolase n=1 Tax=Chloropicon primus TaxID=1764295 RepID=A0A5B8MHN8_9CHLO|nr:NUDIX hydrolase [Chloropicon primus]UPQ99197.1 NUDIX hydrolase [Chloropicon primus]|eukprot:QDZ19986.1 NUDIX hydrolase [Chloropicon primus]
MAFPASEAPLDCDVDVFNGVKVQVAALGEAEDFEGALKESLAVWAREGRTGVWLFVPNSRASWIPTALRQGFDFHHAKPGQAALIKWLPTTTPCMIPRAPFTQVGVGAVIFNSEDEILCVQEALGPLRGKGVWKIVTGSADPGESICTAAEREVFEETGLRTSFDQCLLIRHRYPSATANSDLYFVCALKLNAENQELVIDKTELTAAKWIKFQDYLTQPCWSEGTIGKVYREEINPVIERYRSGGFRSGLTATSSEGDSKYGKHSVYKAAAAGARANHRLTSLFRPFRSGLGFMRRLL